MKMTFAVLLYLLQRQDRQLKIDMKKGADEARTIRRLRCLQRSAGRPFPAFVSGEEDTLYLEDCFEEEVTGSEGNILRPEYMVAMFFSDTAGNPEPFPCCSLKGPDNARQIMEFLSEQWQELDAWENQLARQILQHAPFQDILTHGKTYLRHEYALIDRDMNVMFFTPGYRPELAKDEGTPTKDMNPLSAELTHSLLMRKDFHAAALKTDGFYFYSYYPESYLYCRNIFLFGQYYARLLCRLNEGEISVSQGEACLFEVFARYIELFFENNLQTPDRHQNDLLHQLCRSLYEGEKPDTALLQTALSTYHWKMNHQYQTVVLKAYQQKEWQTQMEITLPFLIRELERQWPDSCAVSLGNRILWLVNLSLTEQPSFFSRFSVFIRENVCRAGVSKAFSGLSSIRSAALEAEAALRLGTRTGETFWYYQFENYRLDYCLEAVTKELPAERLLHPAVRILRDRDIEKGTELIPTLRAYLNCGMNMTHAAEQLYIHRTTFCRRMDHIFELTGISEFSADLMLDLLLSLKLLEEAGAQP